MGRVKELLLKMEECSEKGEKDELERLIRIVEGLNNPCNPPYFEKEDVTFTERYHKQIRGGNIEKDM